MAIKEYDDYDLLYNEYIKKHRKVRDIADDFNVTEMTIWNHLHKYGLDKLRGKGRRLGTRRVVKKQKFDDF